MEQQLESKERHPDDPEPRNSLVSRAFRRGVFVDPE
jgi:hypothetical protein